MTSLDWHKICFLFYKSRPKPSPIILSKERNLPAIKLEQEDFLTMTKPIAWNEGTRITPHHFQQTQLYLESQLFSQMAAHQEHYKGWVELSINPDAISQGVINVVKAQGILGDGFTVNIPDRDPAPLIRSFVGHFPIETESLTVYLGIPAIRPGTMNFVLGSTQGSAARSRYSLSAESVPDLVTGRNPQVLQFATANFQILFEGENQDGYFVLPMIQIVRSATNQYYANPQFVPPLLAISQSSWVHQNLRMLTDLVISKSESLKHHLRQRTKDIFDFGQSGEGGILALIHTLNSSIPGLLHLLNSKQIHPETLYFLLAQLEGQLTTFSDKIQAKTITHYYHDNLSVTFQKLFEEIRELLELVIATRCVQIRLKKVRESLWSGFIEDPTLFENSDFILGVSAQISEEQLLRQVPQVIKVAATNVIDQVLGTSIPAITLTPLSIPPPSLPTKMNFRYFQIDTKTHYWTTIQSSKNVSVYVPNRELPAPNIELFALKR